MASNVAAALPLPDEQQGAAVLLAADAPVAIASRDFTRTKMTVFVTAWVGTALVAGGVLVTGRGQRTSPVAAQMSQSADHIIEEYVKCGGPFAQCGGHGYSGGSCCKAGCTCKPKSDYFSQCVPATKGTKCDPSVAQGKADRIMKKAIPWQAKAKRDASKKAEIAEKAAVAAERLAKAGRDAADLAKAEARAATSSFKAIQTGNGEDWVTAVFHEGGVGKTAKQKSDAAFAAYQTLEGIESERYVTATRLVNSQPKASDHAKKEQFWVDNLQDEAEWTSISSGYKEIPDEAVEKPEVEYEAPKEKSSSSESDSDMVGGVYYTR